MAPPKKNFFSKKILRLAGGVILGGFAGLSLTSSVLPGALSVAAQLDSFFVRWKLSDFAAHTSLVWAIGGWAVVKTGIPRAGALILGLLGLVSGALLAMGSFGNDLKLIALSALAAGFYGAIGGMLLGRVLCSSDSIRR